MPYMQNCAELHRLQMSIAIALCLTKLPDYFLVISYAKYKPLIHLDGGRRRAAAYAASSSTSPSGISNDNASIDPPGFISRSRSQPAPQAQPKSKRRNRRDWRSQRERNPGAGRQFRVGLSERRIDGFPAGRGHYHVVLPGNRA